MEAWIFPLLSPCPRPAFGPVAQQQSGLRRLSKGDRESFLVSHAPCLPLSLYLSLSHPHSPFLSSYQPQIPPFFLDMFHRLWFATKQLFESLRFNCTRVIGKHGTALWFYIEDSFTDINNPFHQFNFEWIKIFTCVVFSLIGMNSQSVMAMPGPTQLNQRTIIEADISKVGLQRPDSVFSLCSDHMVKFFSNRPPTAVAFLRLW